MGPDRAYSDNEWGLSSYGPAADGSGPASTEPAAFAASWSKCCAACRWCRTLEGCGTLTPLPVDTGNGTMAVIAVVVGGQ